MTFPILAGFPVTFTDGDALWKSTHHRGSIKQVQHQPADYRLEVGFPIRLAPKWLLNASEVIVAVHVDGRMWRHRFALVNSRSEVTNLGTQFEEPRITLIGETTGGEAPEWA